MGKRTNYAPGTFAWVDLRTTDLADAKRFYAELFGWRYTDQDTGGGRIYTVASLDGDPVAGLKPLAEGIRILGASPFWLNYVAVADADAAAARTRELGGTVHAEPFDRGAQRLTVITDPTGGTLCLWRSPEGAGACRVNDPGCLSWNELSTNDGPTAIRFYSGLFGWRIEPGGAAAGKPTSWTIGHDEATQGRIGGMRDSAGTPSYWMPCFTGASLDESSARASSAGGRLLGEPFDVRDGRIAVLRDPQGAEFGIFEGQVDNDRGSRAR